jgi:phytoene/squalene synthetase
MNLPHIFITDGRGNRIDLDQVPEPIRDLILSKAAEAVRQCEREQEPSKEQIIALLEAYDKWAKDPREPDDKGPNPINEALESALETIKIARDAHRAMVVSIAKDDESMNTEHKLGLAGWARDEALLSAAAQLIEKTI